MAQVIAVVAAIIVRGDRVLITRRLQDGQWGGYWEFPGGKIKKGELPEEALNRELMEELGVQVQVSRLFWQNRYRYGERIYDLAFYLCYLPEGAALKALQVQEWRWVKFEELSDFSFPPADREVAERLKSWGALFCKI